MARRDVLYARKGQFEIAGQIDHTLLNNIGTNDHEAIDSHIDDSTLHFTEASIDHTAIANAGTTTHAELDSHVADTSIHFAASELDHGSIAGLTDDDHPQYVLNDGSRDATYLSVVSEYNRVITSLQDTRGQGFEFETWGAGRQQINFLGNGISSLNATGDLYINVDTNNNNNSNKLRIGRDNRDAASTLIAEFSEDGLLVEGTLTTTDLSIAGNLGFADNAKLLIGSDDDLEIYHDGLNSYITDVGNGELFITSDNVTVVGSLLAAQSGAGTNAFAAGSGAGLNTQGNNAVAVGRVAGQNTQGANSVAVGTGAAETSQGSDAVALGYSAGQATQGLGAVAVGRLAGQITQGSNSVALGREAGVTSQGANGIILNATGAALDDTTAGHVHIASSLASLDYDGTDWSVSGGNVSIGDSSTGIRFSIQSLDEYRIEGLDLGAAAWNSLHFKADGNDGLFIEKDTNNVGIGTTAPTAQLEVAGTATSTVAINSDSDGTVQDASWLELQDAGVLRWRLGKSTTNEFDLERYNSSGVYQNTPLNIDVTGQMTITSTGTLNLSSTATATSNYNFDTTAINGVGLDIQADTVTTGTVLNIDNADALTAGRVFYIKSNSASSTGILSEFRQDHASSTAYPFVIRNDGNRPCLYVESNTTNGPALDLIQNTNARAINIDSAATTAGLVLLECEAVTTADIVDISAANGLTTGSIMNLASNSTSSGVRNLVSIANSNASATGTTTLKLTNSSTGYALDATGDARITGDLEVTGTLTATVAADHGGLTGLSDDDHTQYLLADGTRALSGKLSLSQGTTVELDITTNGVPIHLTGRATGGTTESLFYADPDNSFYLYYAGDQTFRTTSSGVRITGRSGGANPILEFANTSGSRIGYVNVNNTSGDMTIENEKHGGKIKVIGENASGTAQTLIQADPDTGVAFNGATDVAPPTYTPTNVTTDRTYDANSTTVAELADVVGTIIADLQANGLFQ